SSAPGGFHLAMLPKQTRGNRVQASLTLRFGDERSLAGKGAAAQVTEALLMRGTKSRSRQQLQDDMQKLNATISVGGARGCARGAGGRASGAITATVSTTSENLIQSLRLAVEILREPALPTSDFEQIRRQDIAQIERGRTEPATLVAQTLQ